MPESLFKLQLYLKKTLVQGFSCEFCKIFKNTFFSEHLWMTASILRQLLTLCFAIIYSWQHLSSDKSLVREKNHPYTLNLLQI